ncbi:hypothetical protein GCM10023176_41330 [Micromonospora coerulea]|uniref:Uncharacterized protein n=1 Tax=Micromonospora coerulea TaxID=47856 RepID=A0ABP8STQ2_9ACTN
MFWNVNAVTRLSFAEHGEMLLSVEPFDDLDAPPQITATLAGLNFADHHRGKRLMSLVAVQRFTGHGILPKTWHGSRPPTSVSGSCRTYPRRQQPGSPLGPATEALTGLPAPELRDLAWWPPRRRPATRGSAKTRTSSPASLPAP